LGKREGQQKLNWGWETTENFSDCFRVIDKGRKKRTKDTDLNKDSQTESKKPQIGEVFWGGEEKKISGFCHKARRGGHCKSVRKSGTVRMPAPLSCKPKNRSYLRKAVLTEGPVSRGTGEA